MLSKKPSKQRKLLHEAPLQLRRKLMASHLSKELRTQYKRRSMPIRVGDEVEVMSGKQKKKIGKVSEVDLKHYKVYIEGVTRKRTVGTDVQVAIHPSKLKITSMNLDDEKRRRILLRKVKEIKIPETKPKEEKHEAEKVPSTPVLASVQKGDKVGSITKTRTAQKV